MTYFSVLCGKNVVNDCFTSAVVSPLSLISQRLKALHNMDLTLVSGPKGRGFESRHFDSENPAEQ